MLFKLRECESELLSFVTVQAMEECSKAASFTLGSGAGLESVFSCGKS